VNLLQEVPVGLSQPISRVFDMELVDRIPGHVRQLLPQIWFHVSRWFSIDRCLFPLFLDLARI
jgi:hypothetical protein